MERESSGVNTVLIVIVLLILVGAGVWWFGNARNVSPEPRTDKLEVDVNLPTGGAEETQN